MKIWVWGLAACFGAVYAYNANGQDARYQSVAIAGDFNDWLPSSYGLTLVQNNQWEADFYMLAARTNNFRLYGYSDQTEAWGDSDQTVFTAPLTNAIADLDNSGKQERAQSYTNGWANGSSSGGGFGAWSFSTINGSGGAGGFLGNPNDAEIYGLGSNAFGLYANPPNSGASVTNTLPFGESLAVGQTFSLDFGVNYDGNNGNNGNKGFVLKSGNADLARINNAGTATITLNGQDVGFGYGANMMTWNFTRTASNIISVSANDRDGTGSFSTNMVIASAPDRVAIYASNLSNDMFRDRRQPYFNNFRILATPIIKMLDVEDGLYRFRFHDLSGSYSVQRLGNLPANTNLLRNPSFEDAGSSMNSARHWEYGFPDQRGQVSGDAFREKYRTAADGTWFGALGSSSDSGKWSQDMPMGPAYAYKFTGSFYQDINWSAMVQEAMVEFLDGQLELIDAVVLPLQNLTNTWQVRSFETIAPEGTVWARTILNASGIGASGTLEFDGLSAVSYSSPAQSFTAWEAADYPGRHSHGGWSMTSGLVTTNNARTFRSALLKPGGTITSGFTPASVGVISFWYRNDGGDDDNPPTNAADLLIELSPDGKNFAPLPGGSPELTGILNTGYRVFTVQYTDSQDEQVYLRITHNQGQADILIDDILIEPYSPTLLYQDFNSWSGATNSGCHVANGWILCTGRIVNAGAYSGQSGLLDPPATNGQNTITSPLYTNGIGRVTFQFARWTNGTGSASFLVQASPDNTNWFTIDSNDFVTSTSYTLYDRTFSLAQPHHLRIVNYYKPPPPETPAILINEGFSGGINAPLGWEFLNITKTYDSDQNSGLAIPSLKLDDAGDGLITPELAGTVTNIAFWGKGQTIAATSKVIVYGRNAANTNWHVLREFSGIANTADTFNVPVAATSGVNRVRIIYEKVTGNFALDDLLITGTTGGGNQPPQGLLLDNIGATLPAEFREQTFDTWPSTTSYGEYQHQGWQGTGRTFVNSQFSFAGNAMRLDNRTGIKPAIQSPVFRDEIGRATFKYRAWTATKSVELGVQVSVDGQTWVTITNLTVNSEEYQTFEDTQDREGYYAFRIQALSGAERVMIDEINVRRVEPLATVTLSAFITPAAPYTNDAVHIIANYTRAYGASDIVVTSYYRTGTSGAYTAVAMIPTNIVQLATALPIPPQPTNTIVQYYLQASFKGPGSNITSPVFYPPGGSNNPASYGIPRLDPTDVWINEVKYHDEFADDGDMAYIELAGKAGSDISSWQILIYTQPESLSAPVGKYVIPAGTVLNNKISGHGFWVLGNINTVNTDMLLTNILWVLNPLGIVLRNELGYDIVSLSFGGTLPFYERVFLDDPPNIYTTDIDGINLVGAGSNYVDFAWFVTNDTPGTINFGQQLLATNNTPAAYMEPPVLINFYRSASQMTLISSGNTNNWNASLYYTTELGTSSPVWIFDPSQSVQRSGSDDIVTFTPSTNHVIYRLLFTP